MTGEYEYIAGQTPASNYYSYNPFFQSKHEKIPSANMKRDMTVRSPTLKKSNGPSPVSYPEAETKWITLSTKVTIPKYSVRKAKGDTFLECEVKKHKFVPGVGTHNTDMAKFSLLSRGPSPHYKKGR